MKRLLLSFAPIVVVTTATALLLDSFYNESKMEPRISIVTLGVRDLPLSVAFYRDGLGLPLENDGEGIAFFALEGTKLALYPRRKLAEDATVDSTGSGFAAITLSNNVRSKDAVDSLLRLAEAAGAKIVKPAQEVFWGGYSGYFKGPGRPSMGSGLESALRNQVKAVRGSPGLNTVDVRAGHNAVTVCEVG